MKTAIVHACVPVVLAFGLLASGLAGADTRETQARNLARYTPYLGEPVEDFPFWSLYKWQLVGPQAVVVWTNTKDAWLLTVESPCTRLEWSHGIGLTSHASHHVTRRMDAVLVGTDSCRIETIRPIDTGRMKSDAHAR
jgi:uncharacterized protein DUF6491